MRRKKEDSRDSIPEGTLAGSGYVHVLPLEDMPGRVEEDEVMGSFGVRERVIAWTPWNVPARTR